MVVRARPGFETVIALRHEHLKSAGTARWRRKSRLCATICTPFINKTGWRMAHKDHVRVATDYLGSKRVQRRAWLRYRTRCPALKPLENMF
jgi:hypothetical protein